MKPGPTRGAAGGLSTLRWIMILVGLVTVVMMLEVMRWTLPSRQNRPAGGGDDDDDDDSGPADAPEDPVPLPLTRRGTTSRVGRLDVKSSSANVPDAKRAAVDVNAHRASPSRNGTEEPTMQYLMPYLQDASFPVRCKVPPVGMSGLSIAASCPAIPESAFVRMATTPPLKSVKLVPKSPTTKGMTIQEVAATNTKYKDLQHHRIFQAWLTSQEGPGNYHGLRLRNRLVEFLGVHANTSYDCPEEEIFRQYHQVRAAACTEDEAALEKEKKEQLAGRQEGGGGEVATVDGVVPVVDEEYFEFVMTLMTSRDAAKKRRRYTMFEFGARYGTWAVRGGVAFRGWQLAAQRLLKKQVDDGSVPKRATTGTHNKKDEQNGDGEPSTASVEVVVTTTTAASPSEDAAESNTAQVKTVNGVLVTAAAAADETSASHEAETEVTTTTMLAKRRLAKKSGHGGIQILPGTKTSNTNNMTTVSKKKPSTNAIGILPSRLLAVEGSCVWFRTMEEHFACNRLQDRTLPQDPHMIERFPATSDSRTPGYEELEQESRLILAYVAPRSYDDVKIGQEATYGKARAVSLLDILPAYDRVDMIDFDIQGFEAQVMMESGVMDLVNERVAMIHFGTHATDVEQKLIWLLWKQHNWHLLYFFAGAHTKYLHKGHLCETPFGPSLFNDGALGFANPKFYGAALEGGYTKLNKNKFRNSRLVAKACYWDPAVLQETLWTVL